MSLPLMHSGFLSTYYCDLHMYVPSGLCHFTNKHEIKIRRRKNVFKTPCQVQYMRYFVCKLDMV